MKFLGLILKCSANLLTSFFENSKVSTTTMLCELQSTFIALSLCYLTFTHSLAVCIYNGSIHEYYLQKKLPIFFIYLAMCELMVINSRLNIICLYYDLTLWVCSTAQGFWVHYSKLTLCMLVWYHDCTTKYSICNC